MEKRKLTRQEYHDIKMLIDWLDNEDMRDNIKGRRLVEHIGNYFQVKKIKITSCDK